MWKGEEAGAGSRDQAAGCSRRCIGAASAAARARATGEGEKGKEPLSWTPRRRLLVLGWGALYPYFSLKICVHQQSTTATSSYLDFFYLQKLYQFINNHQ
jgi:hypothetical protein